MRFLLAVGARPIPQSSLDRAADLAQAFKAQVVVLHVRERYYGRGVVWDEGTPADAAERVNESTYALRRRAVTVRGVARLAPAGRVGEAIVAAAIDLGADLILIGRSPESGLSRFTHTGLSQRVVRLAPMPVLVVPAGAAISPKVSSAS